MPLISVFAETRGIFVCARYWVRTSDLFRVREARYRCANRARGLFSCHESNPTSEVGTGFEPVYTDLQSVASPLGQPTTGWVKTRSERMTGFEPATLTLAR